MPDTPQVIINEVNSTFGVPSLSSGISGLIAPMKFGPIGKNDLLITTVEDLYKNFGGFVDETSPADMNSLEAERALKRGSSLRIVNIRNAPQKAVSITSNTVKYTMSAPATTGHVFKLEHESGVTVEHSYNAASGALGSLKTFLTNVKKALPNLVTSASALDSSHFVISSTDEYANYTFTVEGEVPDVEGVAATAIAPIVSYYADGWYMENEKAVLLVVDAAGVGRTICEYVVQDGDGRQGIADGLKTALAANINNMGYTIDSTDAKTKVIQPDDLGAAGNAYRLWTQYFYNKDNPQPSLSDLVYFSGGVTAVEGVEPVDIEVKALTLGMTEDDDIAFMASSKYGGKNYNNLVATISAPSNGKPNYFNMVVQLKGLDYTREVYQNLVIQGGSTDPLARVQRDSKLLQLSYGDLAGKPPSEYFVPAFGAFNFQNGSEGPLTAGDYIGSEFEKTGFFAFDNHDDIWQITALIDDALLRDSYAAITGAGLSYAENRKDLTYFSGFPISAGQKEDIVAMRDSLGINSTYGGFFVTGLAMANPNKNSLTKEITIKGLGDILGMAAYSQKRFNTYISFAGANRGLVFDSLAITNNFSNNLADMQYLANAQVNIFSKSGGKIYLHSGFTSDSEFSQLSFLAIRYLLITIRRGLNVILPKYLEEPNDPQTWKNIFLEGQAFLDPIVSGRGMHKYEWNGDQYASDIFTGLQVNDIDAVQLGKYRIQLKIWAIVPLQVITVDVELARGSGVTINDNLSQIV